MARPTTERTLRVRRLLQDRISDGLHRPGDRFLSNRAISRQYAVSYQTAHRIIAEFVARGLLVRRHRSGTYLPGSSPSLIGAQLFFNRRARRKYSFGSRLLQELTTRLRRENLQFSVSFVDPDKNAARVRLRRAYLPVLWECPQILQRCELHRLRALVLNNHPSSGDSSTRIDSISVDDFSGGASAAQILQKSMNPGSRIVILGPTADPRCAQRIAGFQSVQRAHVIPCAGWYLEHGLTVAGEVLAKNPRAVFACNDRLAEAILLRAAQLHRPAPLLVGFDGAPISAELNFTTVSIPFSELLEAAASVIRRRLAGYAGTAIRQIVAPRPIIRDAQIHGST